MSEASAGAHPDQESPESALPESALPESVPSESVPSESVPSESMQPGSVQPQGGLTGARTFVGFGFGAIQAGLFLYEAFRSGAFGRLVVAEVVPDVVRDLRAAGGFFTVNIAHAASVEQATIGPVEVYNPAIEQDRAGLIDAIADADEMATAVPSVNHYVADSPGSIHKLLAVGLLRKAERDGLPAVLYAAENHNHAAEILAEQVSRALQQERTTEIGRAAILSRISFVNTVIGKMSGVTEAAEGLAPVTPGSPRAFLVEEFNRILISRIRFPEAAAGEEGEGSLSAAEAGSFEPGIQVFSEKENLYPFEEAKLYGHNAMHALAAYLGAEAGIKHMHQLAEIPGLVEFVRSAAIHEAGTALLKRWSTLGDPLFTPAGMAAYVDDLLVRMVNPYLQDAVARVCRDPERKLGWDDRMVGAMRLALEYGVMPHRLALGAAAALRQLHNGDSYPEGALDVLWRRPPQDVEVIRRLRALIRDGWIELDRWKRAGYPNLVSFAAGW